jgi:hypothetical protein
LSARSIDGLRAAWFAIAFIVVSVPHVVDDFSVGEPTRFGVAVNVAVTVCISAYILQLIGAWLALKGSRWGGGIIAAVGLIWVVGALTIHGPEVWADGLAWRSGPKSIVEVTLVVVMGALSVWYGAAASRRK